MRNSSGDTANARRVAPRTRRRPADARGPLLAERSIAQRARGFDLPRVGPHNTLSVLALRVPPWVVRGLAPQGEEKTDQSRSRLPAATSPSRCARGRASKRGAAWPLRQAPPKGKGRSARDRFSSLHFLGSQSVRGYAADRFTTPYGPKCASHPSLVFWFASKDGS
jgi:hypothetical protein